MITKNVRVYDKRIISLMIIHFMTSVKQNLRFNIYIYSRTLCLINCFSWNFNIVFASRLVRYEECLSKCTHVIQCKFLSNYANITACPLQLLSIAIWTSFPHFEFNFILIRKWNILYYLGIGHFSITHHMLSGFLSKSI